MTAATATAGVPAPRERSFPLEAAAEVGLTVVSLATIVSLRRLFLGSDWFGPLALQVVVAHVTMAALRRRRINAAGAAVVGLAFGVLAITWVYAGQFTSYGLPTGASVDSLLEGIRTAFATFDDIKAPVEASDGFLVVIAEAVWLAAVLGDWAAFRQRAQFEALLPSASLFAVASVLGGDVDRVAVTGLWTGAVLVFLLLRRAEQVGQQSSWVGDRHGHGPRALVLLGLGLTAVATLMAALLGPNLPGARSEAIVSLTDLGDDDPGTRVTVSPLVDIRSRLVDQADVEVFRVRSDARAYWRLTSLDRFDGRIWSSNGSFGKTSGALDEGAPVASEALLVTQQYEIAALAQIWLPAAYEPRQVQVADAVRYDEVSGTLIVDTEVPTSDGAAYGVVSELPVHDAAALATASSLVPQTIIDQYLTLPADFPPSVAQLAAELTAGSTSAYSAALALQDYFRNEFTYDLAVGAGHGEDVMEQFLFDLRRGYCEQFAGTYAAMARSIGLPARVAVGFTPGLNDPSDPNLYRVRGEHAHAWPEVFLGEYGWVAFEPTPGRGAPFAQQYTGVPEQQAVSGNPTAATVPAGPPSTVASSPTTALGDLAGPDTSVPDADLDTGGEQTSAPNPWPRRLLVLVVAGLVLGATYAGLVLGAIALRRSRRHRAATTSTARIGLAWDEALEAVTQVGVPRRDAETQSQTAIRVGAALPAVAAPVRDLASLAETAVYAPDAPEAEDAVAALALAGTIEEVVRTRQSPRERLRITLHPRRLLRD